MKTRNLLITTILSVTMALGVTACSHNTGTMASSNVKAGSYTADEIAEQKASDIAENFVGNINFARVALAKHKGNRAEQHIVEARNLMEEIQNTPGAPRRISHIESARVVYKYDTDFKNHYFPIISNPQVVKEFGHGRPVWAKHALTMTDADIVYLTVDLRSNRAATQLDEAETYIKTGNFKAADAQLAKLTDEVVTVDDQTLAPVDRARGDIALARNFVSADNYTGARYALKHADDALDNMQKDDRYKTHRTDIATMRKDVKNLQNVITKKDPAMAEKASTQLDKWWSELKDWSNNE